MITITKSTSKILKLHPASTASFTNFCFTSSPLIHLNASSVRPSSTSLSTGNKGSGTPLPPGYRFYKNHNDLPRNSPQPTMTIYESAHKPPPLPKSSVFHYIFPSAKDKSVYPVPSPDSVAFIEAPTKRQITRGQLENEAKKVGGGLKNIGLKRGEVACMFGMNSIDWVIAAFGVQAAGLRLSPANYAYTPPELLHQLQNSGASVIFIEPALLPVLFKALQLGRTTSVSLDEDTIILLCPKDGKGKDGARFKCLEEMMGDAIEAERFENGKEQETAYMCYSSGTTGLAKGVETSHHNITSQIQALQVVNQPLVQGKDLTLGVLPFSHIYGLTVVLHHPLTIGVPVVILPRFEEIPVLEAIQKYKITWALLVPPVLLLLVHSPNVAKYDISSLMGLMSGAAPLSVDLAKAVEKRLKTLRVTQGYGLTETSPVASVMTLDESRGRQGTIGKLLPTFQARLVCPETEKDVAVGEPGELWLRGPSVMKGYWKNEEATKGTFAEGGWFKTGDVAVIDNEGYYKIVDRLKELIKYKGFQVPPADLEATLLNHPKIADASVIGIYSEEQATELPRAYVVPVGGYGSLKTDKDREAFSKEITEWIQKTVANHKRLRGGCILIEAIPKSPSGKILRKDLRALVAREAQAKVKGGRQAKL